MNRKRSVGEWQGIPVLFVKSPKGDAKELVGSPLATPPPTPPRTPPLPPTAGGEVASMNIDDTGDDALDTTGNGASSHTSGSDAHHAIILLIISLV